MSMIIATSTGFNVEFNVLNVNSSDKLGYGPAALYVPYEQLPRYEGMVKLGGSALIGKHNGKLAYSISSNIENFMQYMQATSQVINFDNQVVIHEKEWNIGVIELQVGKSIWFIDNKAIYECGIIGVFDPVDGECKDKIEINTNDLLEYIEFTFPKEFKIENSPELVVNEIKTDEQITKEMKDLIGDLERLNESVNDLINIHTAGTNLSIADDVSKIEASVNTDNMLASAPVMEPPAPAPSVESLNESYVLEQPITNKIELSINQPILRRAINPLGLKCWKANYGNDTRFKLTFDKLIPECELRIVRTYENNMLRIGGVVTPLRADKQYDSVTTCIGNNEYIHFTANGVYIDVNIISVDLSSEC